MMMTCCETSHVVNSSSLITNVWNLICFNCLLLACFQAEIKKKEEKEAAEALKREEELREARRQKQRLNFLLSQTELYSHFMQNKANLQPGGEGEPFAMDRDGEAETGEEEDTEESELKKEALRAAQLAVSQQKKITDAFDTECSKLRQASELGGTAIDPAIAESNMDLLNP